MIFAAGLGTRLKPITDTMPKALVPVCGKPLLEHVVMKLKAAGIEGAVVTVHHFADMLESWVADHCGLFPMEVSDERTRLLETGGAVLHARKYLDGCGSFLIHNVDIFSNADLGWFASNVKPEAVATLLVSGRKSSRSFLFDPSDMRLVGWKNNSSGECIMADEGISPDDCIAYAFSGIHIMSDTVFGLMEEYVKTKEIPSEGTAGAAFPIRDFYLWAAVRKPIYGVVAQDLKLLDVGKLDSIDAAENFISTL